MTAFLKSVAVWLLAAALTAPAAFAQDRGADYRQEELDQLLAPIALYPDSLLSQVLMASTYPLEVVEAARWSRANSHLKGEDAVKAVEAMDWDPSVKSLVAFPQILHRMDERLSWTQRLGEAFLAQEPQVLDTIQSLRQKAAAAGNLQSSDRMRVTTEGDLIMIEPADPRVVYVPYYDPAVVYGPWSWTGYPPIAWGPPVGYVVAPGWPGFFWASAVVVSTGFFFGHCDFHHRHVKVVHRHVVTHTRFGKPVHTVVTPLLGAHSVTFQKLNATFEQITEAPRLGYTSDSALVVGVGEAFLVKVVGSFCQFELRSDHRTYAKTGATRSRQRARKVSTRVSTTTPAGVLLAKV